VRLARAASLKQQEHKVDRETQVHRAEPVQQAQLDRRDLQVVLELLDQLELRVLKAQREEPDQQVILDPLVHQVRRVRREFQALLEV
jgi:hypothetical protein